jgi:catechol 2,3-dioxygenase-like lactoylglutathione lyase family enzyme
MELDLFAGNPVSDYGLAVDWYSRLLGSEPSFIPDPTEAVWEVAAHRFLYVDIRPEDAGHAICTLFVENFDARLAAIAARGVEPTEVETYDNGVRKAVFHDPDGNEIGLGGAPLDAGGAER